LRNHRDDFDPLKKGVFLLPVSRGAGAGIAKKHEFLIIDMSGV
jgi:hypothetical protein